MLVSVNFISFRSYIISDNMAKKDEGSMPSGFAGLTRYFDESPEKIKMRPEHVVAVAVSIIVVVQLLKVFA